ncbi:MAG: 23S rRNA (uracil(1939)-C(5))-methyltransferase RlmD [Acidobacteriaceae bacterium]
MRLRIEKQIYGGAGLARDEGKAIFVPFTLTDELVEARVTEDHGSYASAELERILEGSPHRAQPPCPYFGECGGCDYQHAEYRQQVGIKSQILREALERARLQEIPEIATLYGEPLGYRNRIRLHVDGASSKLCYKKRASHQNLAVDVCPIAAPVLERALGAMQSAEQQWQLGRSFAEIELFTNAAQDSILLTLWAGGSLKAAAERFESLWPQLRAEVPEVIGAAVFSTERSGQRSKPVGQCGESSLVYCVAGREYWVSSGSFFQVNRFLLDPLVELVTKEHSGKLAWDLYAGVGLFSSALASRFEQVVAVESSSGSVRDLRRNLRGSGHRVVAAGTLDFLRRAGREATPNFVVVDPPRAGLGKEVATQLAAVRPAHITYVSCDPATLSRDLKSLLDSGYHLRAMHMVDLFPQTFHLESVAMLSLE